MKKKIFFVVFSLIILATMRFYYNCFEEGFKRLPEIRTKGNLGSNYSRR